VIGGRVVSPNRGGPCRESGHERALFRLSDTGMPGGAVVDRVIFFCLLDTTVGVSRTPATSALASRPTTEVHRHTTATRFASTVRP
jgi:hypothetical protein